MDILNFFLVFLEGMLAFLSPCILPILPVYVSILSNSGDDTMSPDPLTPEKNVLFKNTIFFILGISTTFFILGTSISLLNRFLFQNKAMFSAIGGLLIIFMGLFYMGYLQIPTLQKERKFHLKVGKMKGWTAYILGFTFSFGWTPCIGPMLASVLLMASNASSVFIGNLLILMYSLGFMIPFIVLALFYKYLSKGLDKLKLHMGTLKKIGGIILIISGLIMFLGSVSGNAIGNVPLQSEPSSLETEDPSQTSLPKETADSKETTDSTEADDTPIPAPDFTLVDQYGNSHTLSDYKGKVVFLNFWATWCPPCLAEMPHIEEIYTDYAQNEEDVVVLGIAMPNVGREGSKEHIQAFLEENDYTFPVAFDETSALAYTYAIQAFPTTVVVDQEGNVATYYPGAMSKETMEDFIEGAFLSR